MHFASPGPDRLDLRYVPTIRLLPGIFCMIIGLTFIFGMARVNTIECTRGVECRFTRSFIIGSKVRAFSVDELRGAHAEVNRGDKGRYSYRVYLNIAGESVFMYTEDGRESQDAVTLAVNAFVKDSDQATLRAVKDDRLHALFFGGLFFLIGVLVGLVFAPFVYLSLDSKTRHFSLRRRTLFSDYKESHPLDDVQGIEIQESISGKGVAMYRLAIVMKHGYQIPLTSFYDYGRSSKERIARTIEQFLTKARQTGPR